MMRRPTVGDRVHYVSHGTPIRRDGSQAFASTCRAADVTEVDPIDPHRIGLMAINPTGLFFHPLADGGCTYDPGIEQPGSPDCPNPESHGNPFRYCACGWREATFGGGTWHWLERVEES
jgi:hypothetical protein